MGARVPDRGRNRREPRPGGRQRRAAGHRQHFDASQTDLNLVAIAYSLGLACSVLYFGAVGDRYGRKGILMIGMAVTIPADLIAAFAPSIGVLFGGANPRRPRRGDGVSDHPGADHGALVGSGPHQVDRALGGHRGSAHRARPPAGRHPLAALLLGFTLPAHSALRGVGSADGDQIHPRPRQRGHRASRPPRRRAHDLPGRRASSSASTSWWSRGRDRSRSGCSQSPLLL